MVVATFACVFALSRGAKGPDVADAKQALIELQVETAVKAKAYGALAWAMGVEPFSRARCQRSRRMSRPLPMRLLPQPMFSYWKYIGSLHSAPAALTAAAAS